MAIIVVVICVVMLMLYLIVKTMIIRRRRELGIQKALGFTTLQLMNQIVWGLKYRHYADGGDYMMQSERKP